MSKVRKYGRKANIQVFLEANLDGTVERYERMSANCVLAGSLFNIMGNESL